MALEADIILDSEVLSLLLTSVLISSLLLNISGANVAERGSDQNSFGGVPSNLSVPQQKIPDILCCLFGALTFLSFMQGVVN